MKLPGLPALSLVACLLVGCADREPIERTDAQEFLRMYEELDQRLGAVSAEAAWKAATDVSERNTAERVGARKALAAFQGSRYVIETSRRLLALKPSLSELEFRELDKILLTAAEAPATIPEVVNSRIETEARLSAILDGFTFCLESRQGQCVKPVTANRIDAALASSRDLGERLRLWEASKQAGPALKEGLAEARTLRNRVATELGYSSYFHLQVADYGMSVAEMMKLMDETLAATEPLYRQLHLYARRQLAKRYKQAAPEEIPAHWLPSRWGQEWPGLAEGVELDAAFRDRKPEWIVQQAERFYTSLGWPSLPRGFWQNSDLYQLPPDSKRKKSTHASVWHIDLDQDVRGLMSVTPSFRWFEASHRELGRAYYYLASSNPRVPVVLREGANRAFQEAVGSLIAGAARREPYLRKIGMLPGDVEIDGAQWLLDEALTGAVVFMPWSAGAMSQFEYDLYEKKLPADQFNRRWWELVRRYQGIQPPSPRGEEYCDACTKHNIIDHPARYYDSALACVIRYQLHDYIARQILHEDPHNCNYYGNKEVGEWLWEILSLGSTRGWRQLLQEKTGEDLSPRALVEYFKPLTAHLEKVNAAAP